MLMHGKMFEGALYHLSSVFGRLRKANLKLNAKKCILFQKRVWCLGHIVSENGIATDPERTECVRSWPQPQNQREVKPMHILLTI